jgi:hypothetical protein
MGNDTGLAPLVGTAEAMTGFFGRRTGECFLFMITLLIPAEM